MGDVRTNGPAKISRRLWLLTGLAPFARAIVSPPLVARVDGDYLRIRAPRLRFLTGKILDRLHDGVAVGFFAQLSLSVDGNQTIQSRSVARFAVSYDIWEETFSVSRIAQTRRATAHLPAEAAQNWLIDDLVLAASDIPPSAPFWLRLDLRAEDGRDSLDFIGGSGISLTRMVEVFSRPPRAAQPHWTVDSGPLYLSLLRPKRPGE